MKRLAAPKILAKYRLLIKNAQEIIIFYNSDMRIIDCNEVAFRELGYGEEIFNISIYEVFQNVWKFEENKYLIDDRFRNRVSETIAYRKNQTCFPVELKVSITKKIKGFVGLCTAINVAEKKEAIRDVKNLKSELKNYDQVSNEMFAMITHELRTPVNGIMGFTNNLMETELSQIQTEAVNIIKQCCEGMNIIINDFLDIAKISNNILDLKLREFNFCNFIRRITDFHSISIYEKGLKLILDISTDIPETVVGDELRLTQILNNLFSNAIKFTLVGHVGLKVILLSQNDNYIELFFMIFDTGIGISLEERDKLFKSFSQIDSSISRRFGGTGLGLVISKKLIEAMNGTIEVDSEKNKGSTFSFSVRLGTPQTSDTEAKHYKEKKDLSQEQAFVRPSINLEGDTLPLSDMEYISLILKEFNKGQQARTDGEETMREAAIVLDDLMEKLIICIEMENWEKAEELSLNMKKLLPKDHTTSTKNFLRLILAVRKKNHDEALTEIKQIMNKEK